jgi:DNA-binding response OmpR family regulator
VKRRIAVIDDEATIAASVAARLRAKGFDVETAADGPRESSSVVASAPTSSCST